MIILDRRKYERIVSELIDAKDIRELAERFSLDRVYYYHILKDIASGQRSPNYKLLKRAANRRKLSEDFVVEQAKTVLNFFVPYYRIFQAESLDYYKILDVPPNATDEEIRRSWIELMKTHHPDKAGADGLDTSKKINEAYEVLSNSAKREAYDNKHLPAMPVIVPQNEMRKYYYAASLMLVVFLAVMYASGSGLIFESTEEKERLAREIEAPDLPNAVYRGDPLDTEKVDRRVSEIEPIKPIEPARDADKAAAVKEGESSGIEEEKALNAPDIRDQKTAALADNDTEIKTETDAEEKDVSGTASQGNEAAEAGAVVAGTESEKKDDKEKPGSLELADASINVPLPDEKTDDAAKEDSSSDTAGVKSVEEETATETGLTEKTGEADEGKGEITEKTMPEREKAPAAGEYYTVRKGDSLWSIAHKFGTTTGELSRLNGLGGNKIDVGDRLLISGEGVPGLKPAPEVAAAEKEKKPEPAPAAPAEKEKLPEPLITKAEDSAKPPVKTDVTEDFDPALATSAVAIRETAGSAPEPIPAAAPPDRDSVYVFVSDYVSAYKNRDIDRVKALFAPDAVENGVSIGKVLGSYSSNFSKLDIVSYEVKVNGVSLQNTLGLVRGDFFITFKDQRTGVLKSSRGNINWRLSWSGGAWKIQELTYRIEHTDTVGG